MRPCDGRPVLAAVAGRGEVQGRVVTVVDPVRRGVAGAFCHGPPVANALCMRKPKSRELALQRSDLAQAGGAGIPLLLVPAVIAVATPLVYEVSRYAGKRVARAEAGVQ